MCNIVAIIGKSGTGKSSLLRDFLSLYKRLLPINELISYTTRPPREKEVNHKDYHFISKEEFLSMKERKDFIESMEFSGWSYGTPYQSLDLNKINIGVFNLRGVMQLKNDPRVKELKVIYLTTEDQERMVRQVLRQKDFNINEIARRFQDDQDQFKKELIDDKDFYILKSNNLYDRNNNINFLFNLIEQDRRRINASPKEE